MSCLAVQEEAAKAREQLCFDLTREALGSLQRTSAARTILDVLKQDPMLGKL